MQRSFALLLAREIEMVVSFSRHFIILNSL